MVFQIQAYDKNTYLKINDNGIFEFKKRFVYYKLKNSNPCIF